MEIIPVYPGVIEHFNRSYLQIGNFYFFISTESGWLSPLSIQDIISFDSDHPALRIMIAYVKLFGDT